MSFRDICLAVRVAMMRHRMRHLDEIEPIGSCLFLAPHPDDEAIGCGGLIARLCAAGRPPHVAILTGGGKSIADNVVSSEEIIAQRRRLTLLSAKCLGVPEDHIHFLDFEDGNIAARPTEEVNRLARLIQELAPDNVFVPHRGEGWSDHLATRRLGKDLATAEATVWEYSVWMWYYNYWKLDWLMGARATLTAEELEAKGRAVAAYVEPKAVNGRPWSGDLPAGFLRANLKDMELYFK